MLGITDTQNYTDIANAIRAKNGSAATYMPSEMAAAISAIPGGGGGLATIKRCEWIANSSKSYIRTNTIPQANDVLTVDFQLNEVANQYGITLAGCANAESGTTNRFLISYQNTSEGNHYQASDKTWRNTTVVADTDRHTIVFDSSGEILLDNTSILTFTPNFGNLNYPLGVFTKWWNKASTTNSFVLGKMFGVSLARNGNNVLNLLPAYIENGAIGMYDTVNGDFFGNMGDSAFTKGADV